MIKHCKLGHLLTSSSPLTHRQITCDRLFKLNCLANPKLPKFDIKFFDNIWNMPFSTLFMYDEISPLPPPMVMKTHRKRTNIKALLTSTREF